MTGEANIPLVRSTSLYLVLDTPKGRGVFASCPIPAGTIVDTCPVIIIPQEDYEKHVQKSCLAHYSYNWVTKDETLGKMVMNQAIVLGLGSMFNHSRLKQNVGWKKDLERQVVIYRTLQDIQEGEELLISYGSKLWFEDADEKDLLEEYNEKAEDIFGRLEL